MESEGLKRPIFKKVKKVAAGSHGGSWKVAYADFVTAMMAFFLLMWLINSVPTEKKKQVAIYFNPASDISKKGGADTNEKKVFELSTSNKQAPTASLSQGQRLQYGLIMQLKELAVQSPELQRNLGFSSDNDGVLFRVDDSVLFSPGKADLKPEASKVLDHVVKVLKNFNYDVVVRGHTDNTENANSLYPSNWELSAARAAAALRYILQAGGISPSRLRATGYADTQPLVPNDTPENRARNRRIEFYYHRPEVNSW
ncbi:MAG: flagellar motor protein MotB [Desulfovibrionaceae bacterium]|nr:flagellar motor protein MotB [Desulfovibrionaceae bacterium]MBF0514509.1 flagellar motor protein MotB [Desulfovibrionaceae bacterium]